MPKILIWMDNPAIPSGYASTCRLTLRELKSRGWEVATVALNCFQGQEGGDYDGIKIFPNLSKNGMYADLNTVIELDKQYKPDIHLFHNDSYRYSYLKDAPKEILNKSIFWLPFEGEEPDYNGVELFKKLSATVFVTNAAFNIHKDIMKDNKCFVIPHAIDNTILKPTNNKQESKIKSKRNIENKFVVTRVDRYQPRKQWELTVEAFAKFAKNKKDVVLLAKCDPHDCSVYSEEKQTGVPLEQVAASFGLTSAQIITQDNEKLLKTWCSCGATSITPLINDIKCLNCNKDLTAQIIFEPFFFNTEFMASSIYHASDVFITTTSGEGFGLCCVEAMACGLPIIHPNVPVFPEIVGNAGISCSIKERKFNTEKNIWHNLVNTDEVSDSLELLYNDWKKDKSLLDRLSNQSLIQASKFFVKEVYDKWDKLLKETIFANNGASVITVLYAFNDNQLTGSSGINHLYNSFKNRCSYPIEWIIVDNNSPCSNTKSWLDSVSHEPWIKIIKLNENRGFAGGCNAGIEQATGKYIILMNPDSEALEGNDDCIKSLVVKLQEHKDIGIVSAKVFDRDDIIKGLRFPYFCCVLITRECLNAIKHDNQWLDIDFYPGYYEDAHFTLKAMKLGFKVVESYTPYWHKSGGTNEDALKESSTQILSKEIDKMKLLYPDLDWHEKKVILEKEGMSGLIERNILKLKHIWDFPRQNMKYVIHSGFGNCCGLSNIAENIALQLDRLGFDVYVEPFSNTINKCQKRIVELYEKTLKAKETDDLYDAVHIVSWLMESFLDIDGAFKVGIAFAESTRIKPAYVKACNSMDAILTFSEFSKKVQIESGVTIPIHVIPPGINKQFLYYYERPINNVFTFLTVGVDQERKNHDLLIKAFVKAFENNKNVKLIVKTNNHGTASWIEEKGWTKKANIQVVHTVSNTHLNDQELFDLYSHADCYISTSHGEGCGYGIIEAAATGCPTIFTKWSAPIEYLTEKESYQISVSGFLTAYKCFGQEEHGLSGVWANPDFDHTVALMKHVVNTKAEARHKGKVASENLLNYSWENTSRQLMPIAFAWHENKQKKLNAGQFNPLTFVKPPVVKVDKNDKILIDITTRDRHDHLTALLLNLSSQTIQNFDVRINDDGSDESLIYNNFFLAVREKLCINGHIVDLYRGLRKGPHIGHQNNLDFAHAKGYKLVCRIDDDILLEPDYLEKLFNCFVNDENGQIAAIGGVYLDPRKKKEQQHVPADYETNPIYSMSLDHNWMNPFIQLWDDKIQLREAEHLYSSFMYRTNVAIAVGGYNKSFSAIGHREESDFSGRFFFAGYKLFLHTKAIGWHYNSPKGGIRAFDIADKQRQSMVDEKIYQRRLKTWKELVKQRKNNASLTIIVNASTTENSIKCIESIKKYSNDIYVVGKKELDINKLVNIGAKMVAVTENEIAILTKQLLTDGNEFIMTISDTMEFINDPTICLGDKWDEYVFEVYTSYMPGIFKDNAFIADEDSKEIMIGPECMNLCLISRKNTSTKRIYYSDDVVVRNDKVIPINGKSFHGYDLIPLQSINKTEWDKICVYQYPKGKLKNFLVLHMIPTNDTIPVLIYTKNQKSIIMYCLDNLYKVTKQQITPIVIDDGIDGTADFILRHEKSYPRIKVEKTNNIGYAEALNIVAGKLTSDKFIILNPEVELININPEGQDWIELLETNKIVSGIKSNIINDLPSSRLAMIKTKSFKENNGFNSAKYPICGFIEDFCQRIKSYNIVNVAAFNPNEFKNEELKAIEISKKLLNENITR